jgi:hypothetical protein
MDKVDILVATPLRLKLLIEKGKEKCNLGAVQFLVLDEADKLFEMGFVEQVDAAVAACDGPEVGLALFTTLFGSDTTFHDVIFAVDKTHRFSRRCTCIYRLARDHPLPLALSTYKGAQIYAIMLMSLARGLSHPARVRFRWLHYTLPTPASRLSPQTPFN